ncbi:ArnT family glycosyltransferase [Leptobacterium sp. I13]|uniref:ArnT family glycosyltransferase n=1 Tax=Leptobacterium meishanense TaxID=3128904 RepID=UPI0030EC27B9
MEARNFISAREMVTEGNWLLTTMNDFPRYEKPPLPTWLTAIAAYLFGIDNSYALRLPTALMAIMLVLVLCFFSLKLLNDKKHSLINGLVIMTSFYIIAITIEAPWDIYTHGFMLTGIYFLFQFFQHHKKLWRNALLAALFIGLSFMSKGPISLYGLFLPFLIAYGVTFRFSSFKGKWGAFIVFLIATILISSWWFVYVRIADPEAFLAITKKETGNWGSYNIRPFYYYWSFFTQSGIWTIPAFVSLLYPYLKNKVSNKKGYLFSFLWTISVVVLLSIIPEKKSRYLVPVLIPLAINIGFYIEYLIREFKNITDWKEKFPIYFHFAIIAAIGIVFPFAGYFMFNEKINNEWLNFVIMATILFIIGISIIYQLRKKNITLLFFLSIGFIMSITVFGIPISKAFHVNKDHKNINLLYQKTTTNRLTVYNYGEIAPEMVWYYGRAIPVLKQDEQITVPSDTAFGVLVTLHEENEFKRIFGKNHTLILEETFDLNKTSSSEQKGYKKRLVSQYYIVKK